MIYSTLEWENEPMRYLEVDSDSGDVRIPIKRFYETHQMLQYLDISEGAMEAYTEKTTPYIDENGEAVITPDIEALVKGLIHRCIKHNLSPMGVLYHTFNSIDDPKHIRGLQYLNTDVDVKRLRNPNMLEFEQAVRYLGLPLCIEDVKESDFVACDPAAPCAAPVGLRYAIMCKPLALPGLTLPRMRNVRMEFIVPWTDELKAYLPDIENRYYAYKDGEDSSWRL